MNFIKQAIDKYISAQWKKKMLDMWCEDIRPTNTSGLAALTNLKNNSIGKNIKNRE